MRRRMPSRNGAERLEAGRQRTTITPMPEEPGDERIDDSADEAEAIGRGEAAADLVAALAGGGFQLIGGPLGQLGGAALGVVVQRVARAIVGRFHARANERAGETLLLVAADAQERRERGEGPRDDGFFDERGGLRADAEEVLEGVLLQAANAFEERKVPLLARLYSAVAHDPTVPAANAHYLVRLAGELTYRQFVALAVFANHDDHFRELARASGLRDEGRAQPDAAILLELDDLGDRRLVGANANGRVAAVVGPLHETMPGYGVLRLTEGGAELARLTGVDRLERRERDEWVRALRGEVASG